MSHELKSKRPSINEFNQRQLVNVNIQSAESSTEPIRLGASWISDMATRILRLAAKLPQF